VGAISADTRAAVDLYHAIEDLPPGIRGDGPPDIPVKQGLLVVQVDVNLAGVGLWGQLNGDERPQGHGAAQ